MSLAARKIRLLMTLRRAGIADTDVLVAMERVPREIFVPEVFADRAYENRTLPIGEGQTITQPLVVARMTAALASDRRKKILEIGTGCGYQTAVLAHIHRRVFTIERFPVLLRAAEARFTRLNLHNIVAISGDGGAGWPAQAPFDRILVTAAAPTVPPALLAQLAEGGVMVLPLGPARGVQQLTRLTRDAAGLRVESLGETRFVPLLTGRALAG